jgi:hypothetical protein
MYDICMYICKKRTVKGEIFQIGPDVKMDDRLGMNTCICLCLCIYTYIYN